MNAYTTKEYTTFYMRLLADDQDLGLDLLSDIIWSPAFRPQEFESERQVILEEILMHADEPSDLAAEQSSAILFPDHPLGREVLGSHRTIEAMTAAEIREFFEVHYRPGNMVAAIAGDLEHDGVVDGLEARFTGPSGGSTPERTPPSDTVIPLQVTRRGTEQTQLVLGIRSVDRFDPRRYPLAILDRKSVV